LLTEKNKKEVKMTKNCIYCKSGLMDTSVIDVCNRCGIGVWGEKMFKAIVDGMEKAEQTGDLHQGSVSNGVNSPTPSKPHESSISEMNF